MCSSAARTLFTWSHLYICISLSLIISYLPNLQMLCVVLWYNAITTIYTIVTQVLPRHSEYEISMQAFDCLLVRLLRKRLISLPPWMISAFNNLWIIKSRCSHGGCITLQYFISHHRWWIILMNQLDVMHTGCSNLIYECIEWWSITSTQLNYLCHSLIIIYLNLTLLCHYQDCFVLFFFFLWPC